MGYSVIHFLDYTELISLKIVDGLKIIWFDVDFKITNYPKVNYISMVHF